MVFFSLVGSVSERVLLSLPVANCHPAFAGVSYSTGAQILDRPLNSVAKAWNINFLLACALVIGLEHAARTRPANFNVDAMFRPAVLTSRQIQPLRMPGCFGLLFAVACWLLGAVAAARSRSLLQDSGNVVRH